MNDGASVGVAARGGSAHMLHPLRRSGNAENRTVHHQLISSLEHTIHGAQRLPGGEHLLRMAGALEVSVYYLVTGEEAVRPPDGVWCRRCLERSARDSGTSSSGTSHHGTARPQRGAARLTSRRDVM